MPTDPDEPESIADVDFPHPRQECIAAVVAARKYIHAADGATRVEILTGTKPEENHRIGSQAAQLLGEVNDVQGYRRWWWEAVVEPGLNALPDVESTDSGLTWLPAVDDSVSAGDVPYVTTDVDIRVENANGATVEDEGDSKRSD